MPSTPPVQERAYNYEAFELREYMTEDEQAQLDMLLWSPETELLRYKTDPVAFAREVLHMDLAPYQERALRLLITEHRICFRGPHGTGKTTLAAAAVLWFISVYDECKIPTTASAWRQLKEFLWPEIHKWALKADWWRVGLRVRPGKELMKFRLEIGPNRVAFAIASSDEAKIEGTHSAAVFYIFDEAKTIVPGIWDAAEGALGAENAFAMALSTPGDSNGRFYEIQTDRDKYASWYAMHVTIQEVLKAGKSGKTQKWVDDRAHEWGKNSTLFKRRVLGQFADDSGDTVIPLSLVEEAQERWYARQEKVEQLKKTGKSEAQAILLVWGPVTHIGCDPANEGADKTGWAFRHGDLGIRRVYRTEKQDTMETANRLIGHMQGNEALGKVDSNGLGAGTFHRVREVWNEGKLRKPKGKYCPVIGINTATGTKATDSSGELGFMRLRDQLWWNVREILEKEGTEFCLPPDPDLERDLTAPKWGAPTGKIKVEAKKDTKARLGRSPDVGDATCLACAPDAKPYKPLFGTI